MASQKIEAFAPEERNLSAYSQTPRHRLNVPRPQRVQREDPDSAATCGREAVRLFREMRNGHGIRAGSYVGTTIANESGSVHHSMWGSFLGVL